MITVKIRKMRFFVLALLIVLLQQCFMHRFQYRYLAIDLISVSAVFFLIYADAKHAVMCILTLGLLRDLSSVGVVGYSMLSFLTGALCLFLVREFFPKNNIFSDLIISYVFLIISGVFYTMLTLPGNGSGAFMYGGLSAATASLLLVPPLFLFLRISGVVQVIKTTF